MEKGVSLYLTIVILGVLTASLLALIGISVSQIKVIFTLGDSVVAFYAADTGIEQALMNRDSSCPPDIPQTSLGQASYEVEVLSATSPDCDADNCCIWSTGTYKDKKRRIEVKY